MQLGNVSSWGINDDLVGWWSPPGITGPFLPTSDTAAATPANLIDFAETYDWLCLEGYPGSSLALSYLDRKGSHLNDGAALTLQAPYQASYVKTSVNQPADPGGINNVGFLDGHVKSMKLGQIAGIVGNPYDINIANYWSVGGNGTWR